MMTTRMRRRRSGESSRERPTASGRVILSTTAGAAATAIIARIVTHAKATPNPQLPTPKAAWELEVGGWALSRPGQIVDFYRLDRPGGGGPEYSALEIELRFQTGDDRLRFSKAVLL